MARRNDNSLDYWKRREAEARKNTIEDEAEYKARIEEIYKYTAANIERQVNDWYARYAKENGMFMSEAKERVRKLDMERYEALARKYVATHDFSDQANEEMELYNLTMRINRLELLKAQINLELLAGYDDIEHELERDLIETAMKEDRRLAGILGDSVIGNERYAAQLVNASFKNATFSERLWGNNMPALRVHLEAELRNGLIQGIHPRELARRFRRHYSGSVRDTERLMTTEMCRLQTAVQKESFERNGFTEYRFITAGDGHVCPVCEDLHGQHFKVSEMQPGDNAPPMHPSCRCSTAAWMDGDKYKRWIDALANGEDVRWNEFEAEGAKREINYMRHGVTNDSDDDIIKVSSETTSSTILAQLAKSNIKANQVSSLKNSLSSEDIVKKIHGRDRSGSCTSLALAYIGNKVGLDVKDLRGGESAKYFADTEVVKAITEIANGKIIKKENDFDAVKVLLKDVKKEKEYFLSSGKHSAIVRKAVRGYEYLRLQDGRGIGFFKLNDQELKNTFGCSKTHTRYGVHYDASSMLFDIDNLNGNKEFEEILKYINSQEQ